jgi:DUF971 family protein
VAGRKGPLLPLVGRDPNTPRDVRLVGRYAIGVEWQDDHSSIYPFEFLRAACPCPACEGRSAAPVGDPQAWPVEIKKAGTGLFIVWQDGHETTLGGRELRQLCRCATCTTAGATP